MSELATLARPYAEAIFESAKDKKSTKKWSLVLEILDHAMANKKLSAAVDNPRVDPDGLSNLLIKVCKDSDSGKEAENLIKLLLRNNRFHLIGQIRELFEKMKADDEGYIEVDVNTAFPLTQKNKDQLSAVLTKKLKRNVRLNTEEDKSLIGGVLIKAGDLVIDGSIRGQIQKLAKRLYS
ncbi:MAG: F0F1 ATP synthase subunit delta [Methylococcales bacterium]